MPNCQPWTTTITTTYKGPFFFVWLMCCFGRFSCLVGLQKLGKRKWLDGPSRHQLASSIYSTGNYWQNVFQVPFSYCFHALPSELWRFFFFFFAYHHGNIRTSESFVLVLSMILGSWTISIQNNNDNKELGSWYM